MEFHPSPMDWVGISRSHASMHVWQLSLVIFGAAGMCNGRVCSGRERRNGYSLPQAILTLTDDEWDGEEWLSSFRLLWSAETGQGHFEFYCSMYKSTGLSFFNDCNSRTLILSLADNNCTKWTWQEKWISIIRRLQANLIKVSSKALLLLWIGG